MTKFLLSALLTLSFSSIQANDVSDDNPERVAFPKHDSVHDISDYVIDIDHITTVHFDGISEEDFLNEIPVYMTVYLEIDEGEERSITVDLNLEEDSHSEKIASIGSYMTDGYKNFGLGYQEGMSFDHPVIGSPEMNIPQLALGLLQTTGGAVLLYVSIYNTNHHLEVSGRLQTDPGLRALTPKNHRFLRNAPSNAIKLTISAYLMVDGLARFKYAFVDSEHGKRHPVSAVVSYVRDRL